MVWTGLIEKILNLFGFGRKPVERKSVSLQEIRQEMLEKSRADSEGFNKNAFSKFSEIKYLLSEMRKSLSELSSKQLTENQEKNKRLKKIIETSRQNLLNRMDSLAAKLEPPSAQEPEAVRQYCLKAGTQMQAEIASFGKSIAYTGIYLRDSVKTLGQTTKELQQVLLDLQQSASSAQTRADTILAQINEMERMLEEKKDLLRKTLSLQQNLRAIESEKNSLAEKISSFKESEEFSRAFSLKEKQKNIFQQKSELKNKAFEIFSKVEKPLKRLLKLAESGQFAMGKEQKRILSSYMKDPLNALKQDPKADYLKELLRTAKKLVEENTITFKEKEKGKKLEAIKELLAFDFFENFFWKLNSLELELQKIEREMSDSNAQKRLFLLEGELSEKQKAISEYSSAIQRNELESKKLEEQTAELKQGIEQSLETGFGKKYSVEA